MRLDAALVYTMTLSNEEFGIVSRALRGILRPDEVEQAKELQTAMMKDRVARVRQLNDQMEKLAKSLENG